jgi:hypothetical protein
MRQTLGFKQIGFVSAALLMALASGCNNGSSKNNDSNRVPVTNGNPTTQQAIPTTPPAGTAITALTCQQDPTATVKSLFSAVVDPSQIGTVNSTSGITFYGKAIFPATPATNGINTGVQLLTGSSSYLVLTVTDSNAASGKYGPLVYEIGMSPNSSGTYYPVANGQPGQIQINFVDYTYGAQISITGQVSAGTNVTSTFTGSITVTKNGVAETLGSFSMQTCSFIDCKP